MAMEFGKLNFAVGFNRTSAFPLDANSYFESYAAAETAVRGAAEVGSSDSAYYLGQLIIINDKTADASKGIGLYQITGVAGSATLTPFGKATTADELGQQVTALQGQITTINGKLILADETHDGFLSKEGFKKLKGIAEGAQVNVIETVKVNGEALVPTDKAVNIDLGAYATTEAVAAGYVAKEAGKGLSTNDYDATAKGIVDGITAKVEAVDAKFGNYYNKQEVEDKIAGKKTAYVFTNKTDPLFVQAYGKKGSFVVGDNIYFTDKKVNDMWVSAVLETAGTFEGKEGAAACYYTFANLEVDHPDLSGYATLDELTTEINAEKRNRIDADNALEGKVALKADATALTAAEGRIAVIEGDYLKAADKTALQNAIALKADNSALQTTNLAVEALEGKVGTAGAGQTGTLFELVAGEATARKAADDGLAARITTLEGAKVKVDDITIRRDSNDVISVKAVPQGLITGLGSGTLLDALDLKVDKVEGSRLMTDEEGTKLAGIAAGAEVNVIDRVTFNGVAAPEGTVANKVLNLGELAKLNKVGKAHADQSLIEYIDNSCAIKTVNTDQFTLGADKKLDLKQVTVDLLANKKDVTLVLDGGEAA